MKTIIIDKIKVTVFPSTDPTSSVKATANVTLDPFKIKGYKILESKTPGDPVWVAPPSYRGRGGKFHDTVYCEDRELWGEIEEEIIAEYNRRIKDLEPKIPIVEEKKGGGYAKHF